MIARLDPGIGAEHGDADVERGHQYGVEIAGGARGEAGMHGHDVAVRPVGGAGGGAGIDLVDGPEELDEAVGQMNAHGGHAGGGGVDRGGAPVGLRHRGELVVAEIRLDMHDRAERAGLHQALDLQHGRLVAALMADAELHPGGAAGGDRALGIRAGERQRLLAEDVLAGAGRHRDLRGVQRVRRAQDDRIDRGIVQHVVPVGRERNAVLGGEGSLDVRGVDGGDDAELVGIRHAADHVLAPPAEAGDRGADHVSSLAALAGGSWSLNVIRRRRSGGRHSPPASPSPP